MPATAPLTDVLVEGRRASLKPHDDAPSRKAVVRLTFDDGGGNNGVTRSY